MSRPIRFSLKLLVAVILSSAAPTSALRAHEVQPIVMDVTVGEDEVTISADWMIETAVADMDLSEAENTRGAENDREYDRLRALEPAALEEAVRAAWPGIAEKLELRAGGTRLALELDGFETPGLGNLEVARISTLALSAALPGGAEAVTIRAAPELGPMVVRQAGVENGYAAFLTPGTVSGPIPAGGEGGGEAQSGWAAFTGYIGVGFDHIVPQGLDHILFVLGLFFLSTRMGPLLWQVTAFTLAHTVTLALGALDVVRIPAGIVEPLIAASIVYVGVENLFLRNLSPWRPFVVFGFGLLHGLGFAAVLQDFGLGASHFVPKLLGFNLGVEIGQLAVIAAAWLTLTMLFGAAEWYHRRIAAPVSVAVALIAAFWVLERTGTIAPEGPWSLFSALTEGGFNPLWVTVAAVAVAAVLTGLEMLTITEDLFREFAGVATSFVMFLALVATFSGGAWLLALVVAAVWVLCLRFQSLGGPDGALA